MCPTPILISKVEFPNVGADVEGQKRLLVEDDGTQIGLSGHGQVEDAPVLGTGLAGKSPDADGRKSP